MTSQNQQSSSPGSAATPPPAAASPSDNAANSEANDALASAARLQREHLSEEQKKANHIASEKKRRNNIREQYDKLAEMTPGMEGQGRSEGRVLEETVKYAKQLLFDNTKMIDTIEEHGGVVDDELKRSSQGKQNQVRR